MDYDIKIWPNETLYSMSHILIKKYVFQATLNITDHSKAMLLL